MKAYASAESDQFIRQVHSVHPVKSGQFIPRSPFSSSREVRSVHPAKSDQFIPRCPISSSGKSIQFIPRSPISSSREVRSVHPAKSDQFIPRCPISSVREVWSVHSISVNVWALTSKNMYIRTCSITKTRNTPFQIYRKFHHQKLKIFRKTKKKKKKQKKKQKPPPDIFIFLLSMNKKNNVYHCKSQFYYIKVGFKGSKLYRHVFVMAQRIMRSVCAFEQSDQNLHWTYIEKPGMQSFFMRKRPILIRLCGDTCWFESSLDAHVWAKVLAAGMHWWSGLRCLNKHSFLIIRSICCLYVYMRSRQKVVPENTTWTNMTKAQTTYRLFSKYSNRQAWRLFWSLCEYTYMRDVIETNMTWTNMTIT